MEIQRHFLDFNRRAADLVGKILRAAKPADLAVEQPTKFDLRPTWIPSAPHGIEWISRHHVKLLI